MLVSTPGNSLHFRVPAQFREEVMAGRDVSSNYQPPCWGQSWVVAALVGPRQPKSGSRLENRLHWWEWVCKAQTGLGSMWGFSFSSFSFSGEWWGWDSGHTRAANYQRAGRFGNFKILEMLIPFGSCFKGQTNGAPVSACALCQNSRDNICAHPGLKISCQRIQLLKWAKQNSCIIEIHFSEI